MSKWPSPKRLRCRSAFSLPELMISAAFILVLIGLVAHLTGQTSEIWRSSNARMRAFQDSRAAYDSMARKLSQATLNTYNEYYDAQNRPRSAFSGTNVQAFTPVTYSRYSDLHFVCGQAATLLSGSTPPVVTQTHAVFFQAPLGYSVDYRQLDTSMNACGYFLQFANADATVPDHVKLPPGYQPRYRFRLMEMMQTTEQFAVYSDPAATPTPGPNDWFVKSAATSSRIVGENVIALIVLPLLSEREDLASAAGKGVSIAPAYCYNSRVGFNAASDTNWPSATPAFPGDKFTHYPSAGAPGSASRHHQMPPMVRVVMVVIDEASAFRLQGTLTSVPPAIDFRSTPLFKDASRLKEDLQAVEDICNAKAGNLTGNKLRLTYRIFTSDLIIQAAKWSNK